MKRVFSGIFVVTTLLLAPGCSSNTKSPQGQVSPSMIMNHGGDSMNGHEGHSMEQMNHGNNSQITTKVKLTAPKSLAANQPINLFKMLRENLLINLTFSKKRSCT